MKAVILLRVSSKEQEDNHSLKAQLMRLEEYCERKKLTSPKIFKVVESSTRGERKQFKEVIEYIKAQKEKPALVVEAVDRLQRSFKESVLFDEMMKKGQVELHFVRENLVINENASPTEVLMWDFFVIGAKNYVLSLSSNIKRSNEKKLKSGEWTGKAPVGYLNRRNERNQSEIYVDETRAYLVKEAFTLFATGNYSVEKLTRTMREKGLTGNSGLQKPLVKSGIHRMLNNRFYIGFMNAKNKQYKHNYDTFVDEWTFHKCQEILTGRNKKSEKHETKREFIFQGLLRNKETGRLLSGDIKKGKYIYYYSPKYLDSPASERVNEKIILNEVKKVFKQIKVPDDILNELRVKLKETHEAKENYKEKAVDELQAKIKGLKKREANLFETLITENDDIRITQDEYTEKIRPIKQQVKNLQLQIQQFDDADEKFVITVQYLLELCSRAYEVFESSKVEQQRQLLKFVFSNLYLDGKKLHYDLNKPFDAIMQLSKCSKWYTLVDILRTDCYQEILNLYNHIRAYKQLLKVEEKYVSAII